MALSFAPPVRSPQRQLSRERLLTTSSLCSLTKRASPPLASNTAGMLRRSAFKDALLCELRFEPMGSAEAYSSSES
eukprot:3015566-Pleurochrysis_carterae.AAC.6